MVQPLLERHPDLALVGRWLYLKPIHHFARGILIDRGYYKERFHPRWAVLHLFQIHQHHIMSWGGDLTNRRSPYPGIWSMSDTDVQLSLIEEVEKVALPNLRSIKILDDYLKFVAGHTFWNHLFERPSRKIIIDIAIGNLEPAKEICKRKIDYWSIDHSHLDAYDKANYHRLRELCARLVANNRTGLAQLLHEWEAETVRSFKIAHLWEPTPFPLEDQF
ncbi:hypothetical protein ABLE91_27305 [Aquabacter sp. CN5-332]|uniref:hypothetical protein n=1 Tax=Aquabacter sp. CN5-332 TaxID=3156608 RepID=UPI0032B542D3